MTKKSGMGKVFILLGADHYFFGGGGIKNPEKNCLQNQKSPNKLFADMIRRK